MAIWVYTTEPKDPWMHLLRDKEGEKKFNFKLSASLKSASETPLLAGWIFHATPSVLPPPVEMQGWSFASLPIAMYRSMYPSQHTEMVDGFLVVLTPQCRVLFLCRSMTAPLVGRNRRGVRWFLRRRERR